MISFAGSEIRFWIISLIWICFEFELKQQLETNEMNEDSRSMIQWTKQH